jgi:hypothetical protein
MGRGKPGAIFAGGNVPGKRGKQKSSFRRSPFHLIGVAEGNTGEGGMGKRSVQNKRR